MKQKFRALAVAALLACSSAAYANPVRPLGLGVIFGEPTGLTLKYWTHSNQALSFGVAYSFGNSVTFIGDYLWHFLNAFSSGRRNSVASEFTPYLGVGGVIFFKDERRYSRSTNLGIRIPLGIEFRPVHPPIGVYLELVPAVAVAPSVYGFVQGGIGIRYYF